MKRKCCCPVFVLHSHRNFGFKNNPNNQQKKANILKLFLPCSWRMCMLVHKNNLEHFLLVSQQHNTVSLSGLSNHCPLIPTDYISLQCLCRDNFIELILPNCQWPKAEQQIWLLEPKLHTPFIANISANEKGKAHQTGITRRLIPSLTRIYVLLSLPNPLLLALRGKFSRAPCNSYPKQIEKAKPHQI